MMTMLKAISTHGLLASMTLAISIIASEATAQETETTTYEDWVVVCSETDNAACRMQQAVTRDTEQGTQSLLSVSIFPGNESRIMELIVPLGIDLASQIRMIIDNENVLTFSPDTCVSQGCFKRIPLVDQLFERLKAGVELSVAVTPYGNSEETTINGSLLGFTAASNAVFE